MSSETSLSLQFPRLKYDVQEIQRKLDSYPQLDGFVFLPSFENTVDYGSAILLKAYIHGNSKGSTLGYHESYYDWENPDTLTPYANYDLMADAPLILTTNIISKTDILTLITNETETVETLTFTPVINQYSQLYYEVWPAKIINGDYVFLPIPGVNGAIRTNPSPPATIDSMDEN
ncbi:hypothetical protein KHS38_02425 [Mucilaginibacter sp. Bleaf8]|uniref:hypothetical protein n=1 Tax=Mucilaginibacter sp. Bleaf8 TaxID=2834430 RepID=UPI001BCCF655|nr:hypothetical protein [Mucilaginibacter sp. Bleaf8]MBS7563249.1 hypothetical protein [Mucilaginibacter sp. Bleaf8]